MVHRGLNKPKPVTVSNLRIASLNARSLQGPGRLEEINELLSEKQIHVLAVQETWRKSDDAPVHVEGFRWYGVPRSEKNSKKKRGGGVGFLIAEKIKFSVLKPRKETPIGCETAAITIHLKGSPRLHLVCAYVPPETRFDPEVLPRSFPTTRIMFVGDFNAHVSQSERRTGGISAKKRPSNKASCKAQSNVDI